MSRLNIGNVNRMVLINQSADIDIADVLNNKKHTDPCRQKFDQYETALYLDWEPEISEKRFEKKLIDGLRNRL